MEAVTAKWRCDVQALYMNHYTATGKTKSNHDTQRPPLCRRFRPCVILVFRWSYLDVGILHVDDAVEVGLGSVGVPDQQVEGGPQEQGLRGVAAGGVDLLGAFTDDLIIVLLLHVLLGLQVAGAEGTEDKDELYNNL